MNRLEARIRKIEAASPAGKTHFVWICDGENASEKRDQLIQLGRARPDDKFCYFSWKSAI